MSTLASVQMSVTYKRSKSSQEAQCSYLSRVPFYLKVSILEYVDLKISGSKRFWLQKFLAVKNSGSKNFQG